MNLRTVTIWATGVTWVLTNLMIFVYFFLRGAHYSNFSPMTTAASSLMHCLFLTSPLLVSLMISVFSTRPISLILLLLTTFLNGIGVFGALCSTWGEYSCMSGIEFFSVAIVSLFYMVPTWIIALILNSLCASNETAGPGTSASSPIQEKSPAPWENEQ